MLVVLCMIALSQSLGASIPVIPNTTREEPQLTAPLMLQGYRPRTRFDIIWSCLSTLFICTWVAIHPNIPPRGEGHIRSLWRRIKLMLWTLLVPELILIWAYRQWSAARNIAELFKEEGWTATHGHFLIMGGFIRAVDGTAMEYDDLLYPDPTLGEIAFPTITASEIQDKARGDFLSKAIVILQSIWFIAQCIARGIQGLALTELELVTLALASLNGVMYYFWWDKPLGVNEPIKVYPINVDPPKQVVIDGDGRWMRFQASLEASLQLGLMERYFLGPFQQILTSISQNFGHFCSIISSCGAPNHHRLPTITLSTIKIFLHEQRKNLDFPGDQYLWFLYLPVYWFFQLVFEVLGVSLADIANTREIKPNSAHVPAFYAPCIVSSGDNVFVFVLPIVAAVFGALHLIAWQFHFPSYVERLLWHIGSLAITIIPLVPLVLLILALLVLWLEKSLEERLGFHPRNICISLPDSVVEPMSTVVFAFFLVVGLAGYMLARLLLLTQAVVLLREQPDSVFYAINWSRFLPHI